MTKAEYASVCEERLGKENFQKLQQARVAVAGLGGLGSHIAIMLARSCVGTLHIVDFDRVDYSNLNRQAYELSQVGKLKTQCMQEKLLAINPFLTVITDCVKVTEENIDTLFKEDTIVCEAFDDAKEKSMLINGLLEKFSHTKIISGSGMAGYGDANEIITKQVFKNLYVCGDRKAGLEEGLFLLAPRVNICAGHQANKVIQSILL